MSGLLERGAAMRALEHIIDPEKPAYQLMPWDALDQVGLVFAYGAHKHGEGDYRGPDGPGLDYCCCLLYTSPSPRD